MATPVPVATYEEQLYMLTVPEACRIVGCEAAELARRRRAGQLPGVRGRDGGWYFHLMSCRKLRQIITAECHPDAATSSRTGAR